MNLPVMRRRSGAAVCDQGGFVLVPVILLIAMIAALALFLNRQSAMVGYDTETSTAISQAGYLAESALSHAAWQANASACAGYALPATPIGGNSYHADFSPTGGSPVTITATGTLASGATRSVVRTNVRVFETPITQTLQPAQAGEDTYLDSAASSTNFGGNRLLIATNSGNQAHPLLRFDLSALPSGIEVRSATLTLSLTQLSSGNSGGAEVHRVTRAWAENQANWLQASGAANWTTPGGEFETEPAASATVDSAQPGPVQWDITDLVGDWVAGAVPNEGLLIRVSPGVAGAQFASSDHEDAAQHPTLTVTYACECGVGNTDTWTHQPGAAGKDTHVSDGGKATTNYGVTSTLELTNDGLTATQGLIHFDLSDLNPAATVTGAVLELELTGIGSANAGTATVHRVTRPWHELQATWNEASGGAPWVTPGGDYDAAVIASASISDAQRGPVQWDVTPLVQGWHNGSIVNDGLMLLVSSGITKAKFTSSENSKILARPKLIITHQCPCGVECVPPQIPLLVYRDELRSRWCDSSDYSGSDGNLNWSSQPWQELGEGNGSCNGSVRLVTDGGGYSVRLTDDQRGLKRALDLSSFVTGRLSFSYRRAALAAGSYMSVDMSADGGATWNEVHRIYGPADEADYLREFVDVAAFAGTTAVLRFMVHGLSSGDSGTEHFYIDDVQVDNITAPPLPPGVSVLAARADATAWENAESNNTGNAATLTIDGKNKKRQHGLLEFDTSSVAPGTLLDSAMLRLFVTGNANALPTLVQVYRVSADWEEMQMSWEERKTDVDWSTPGGTYAMPAVADEFVPDIQQFFWLEIDITPLVQEWVDGTSLNHGIILTSDRDKPVEFASKEYSDPVLRPQLVINEQ